MEAECRVRLVFADELGRHVLRRRGFTSCWYLVPRDVKLVGDLGHLLLREFGLRKRCPLGLELRLQDLPVLATQSIRIIRDDDTIAVQCPAVEGERSSSEESSSDEELKHRKALRLPARPKKRREEKKIEAEKRGKQVKDTNKAAKRVKVRERSDSSSSDSSSSSSSDSSSSSSSSSSESEEESTAKTKQVPTATVKKRVMAGNGIAVKRTHSDANAGHQKVPETAEKGPRRKRRRLRNRSRNGVRGLVNDSSNMTGSNGAKPTDRIEATLTSLVIPSETRERELTEPELAKYGPSSSDTRQQEVPSRKQNAQSSERSSSVHSGAHDETSVNDAVRKHKPKNRYEERWKRPYEIVATVLDKKSGKASEGNKPTTDITELLASFPTVSPACFEVEDIVAIKTLTLCLETWQPVLSNWQCGQVQSVDSSGSTIELTSWTLEANNAADDSAGSVIFHKASNSERRSIQTSEISELRFLSGPTYSSIHQDSADTTPTNN
ncbi:hypothetical protein PHYBOEH_006944 [Phytophthora boehmeriae]|uniref:Coilin N-terminal domain-containing protein n=1 Tax=Phytophthora boehmeriae TaxID=109152 RepID=A0A8T1WBQ7_9STRA|nr:hypothetical protein PHYBOEH_006944 [Phytophthora boehmeriae]